MRKLLAAVLCLPLVACVVGDGTDIGDDQGGGGGGGGGDGSGDGSGGGMGSGISGKISADTTWSDAVYIGGNVTIDPGVTVTIAAGANVTVKAGANITVNGILDAQGTSAGKINITGEKIGENNAGWGGVTVNGELKYSYVTQTHGSVSVYTGGKATIVDTHFSQVSGDFLILSGGNVDMQYSQIGLAAGETDTTHCDMHFGGQGNVIKVVHTNVSTSAYGIMFYGGQAADFTYNNWFSNSINVDTQAASPVSGDFSNSYFEGGAPTGAGITAGNISATMLAACDGTNDAVCAGPRP